MNAVQELQRNIAAEATIISDVGSLYSAVVTPHQSICADVSAWPHDVYLLRLMRYLGALELRSIYSPSYCQLPAQQLQVRRCSAIH